MEIIQYDEVEKKIILIRGQKVIIDSDVAELYGVETKRINEAVKNNTSKFLDGYLIDLTVDEWDVLKSKFSTSIKGGKLKLPKAFTERGLYMLATILKSPKATATTLAIIETFAKVREISQSVIEIINEAEDSTKLKPLTDKVGTLIGELIMPNNTELETVSVETSTKLKFLSMIEVTRTVVKKPKNN